MYKKVYVEITNCCNLNCSFCIGNTRPKKYMSIEEFKIILKKLQGRTKYLYFHVLGEPLLHPNINEFINLASLSYKVNITTNGYLINKIVNNSNIRQLNISLHSYDEKYGVSLEDYMNNIFSCISLLSKDTYISLRLWTDSKYTDDILNLINNKYNLSLEKSGLLKNNRITDHVFLNKESSFIWPDLNNNYYNENGKCYGLIDHIGILVDGTIVPCCLDSKGIINLGNIYTDNLNLDSNNLCKEMINGFKNNKKIHELCKKCNFIDK